MVFSWPSVWYWSQFNLVFQQYFDIVKLHWAVPWQDTVLDEDTNNFYLESHSVTIIFAVKELVIFLNYLLRFNFQSSDHKLSGQKLTYLWKLRFEGHRHECQFIFPFVLSLKICQLFCLLLSFHWCISFHYTTLCRFLFPSSRKCVYKLSLPLFSVLEKWCSV